MKNKLIKSSVLAFIIIGAMGVTSSSLLANGNESQNPAKLKSVNSGIYRSAATISNSTDIGIEFNTTNSNLTAYVKTDAQIDPTGAEDLARFKIEKLDGEYVGKTNEAQMKPLDIGDGNFYYSGSMKISEKNRGDGNYGFDITPSKAFESSTKTYNELFPTESAGNTFEYKDNGDGTFGFILNSDYAGQTNEADLTAPPTFLNVGINESYSNSSQVEITYKMVQNGAKSVENLVATDQDGKEWKAEPNNQYGNTDFSGWVIIEGLEANKEYKFDVEAEYTMNDGTTGVTTGSGMSVEWATTMEPAAFEKGISINISESNIMTFGVTATGVDNSIGSDRALAYSVDPIGITWDPHDGTYYGYFKDTGIENYYEATFDLNQISNVGEFQFDMTIGHHKTPEAQYSVDNPEALEENTFSINDEGMVVMSSSFSGEFINNGTGIDLSESNKPIENNGFGLSTTAIILIILASLTIIGIIGVLIWMFKGKEEK